MKQAFQNIWQAIRYVISTAIFWILTFCAHRIILIALNSDKAIDTPFVLMAEGMLNGLIFDLSLWGYMSLLTLALVLIFGLFTRIKPALVISNVITGIISTIIVVLLPANGIIYSYWGRHYEATDLGMIADNPSLAFASVDTSLLIIYTIIAVVFALCNLILLRRLTRPVVYMNNEASEWIWPRITQFLVIAVIAGSLIIPVRGGVGLAPLNTGRAYFSNNLFANHLALNPVWNFIYSIKRAKQTSQTYHYMDDNEAQKRFEKLTDGAHSSDFLQVLKTARPNVVVILLESFSAHGIEMLGGENVTPNLKAIAKEGIFFNNIYSAADRSGKGLVAAMCGYPVLPTYSIIQYPQKTQCLPFVAQHLRKAGYESQTFIYGGDLGFNSFNSLVTLAGFNNIITEDDFPVSAMGDKWGAHDEFTFERLLKCMDEQEQPFFNFFFTLSSHEPFTVPMEKVHDNPYLNSMYYTDKCLGEFFAEAKKKSWWNNTLFIMMADHGHDGPNRVGNEHKMKYNIPLVMAGGALAVTDTVFTRIGSQIDLAATLLPQLGISPEEFTFSKNLFSNNAPEYAFYDFNDGYGYVTPKEVVVYDNKGQIYLREESLTGDSIDTQTPKAILQVMSEHCNNLGK